MSSASISTSRSTGAGAAGDSAVVRRFRFTDDTSHSKEGYLKFTQPRPVLAMQEDLSVAELSADGAEPTDHLEVVVSPRDVPGDMRKKLEAWLAPGIDAPPVLSIELDGARVLWRPGRAWIQASTNRSRDLLAGLIEFAFYEGELRRLEQSLPPFESDAQGDADLAFRVQSTSAPDRERFGKTIESLARLRLTFARLEPQLYLPPRALPLQGRRLVSRLRARADVSDRLEALSDRLEACEDLYEGAVDRITDYRLTQKSLVLEVAIIVLLAIETVLLAWQFYQHR